MAKEFECKCDDCELSHCSSCGCHMIAGWMGDNVKCNDCLILAKEENGMYDSQNRVPAQPLNQKSYEERCKRWEDDLMADDYYCNPDDLPGIS